MNRSIDPSKLIMYGLSLAGIFYLATLTTDAFVERIKIGRPRAKNFSFDLRSLTVRFSLVFPLTNDLPFQIPSNLFRGLLFFNGVEVGGVQTPLINVPSRQTEELDSVVVLSLDKVFDSLTGLIANPQLLFNSLRVKGEFTSNGITLPYESSIQLIN